MSEEVFLLGKSNSNKRRAWLEAFGQEFKQHENILISILLAALTETLADLPSSRRHHLPSRISPKEHRYSLSLHGPSPKLQYGPPSKISQSSSLLIPGGLTIEDLIRLTEKLQSEKYPSGFQPVRYNKPQKLFQPPAPQKHFRPSTDYQTITDINNFPKNQLDPPRTSYGVPIQPQNNVFQPQNTYGLPNKNIEPLNRYQNLPLPNKVNSFWNNNGNNKGFSAQHLPVKEAAQFRPTGNVNPQQSQNFIPSTQTFHNSVATQPLIPKDIPNVNPNGFGLIPDHPQNHFHTMRQGLPTNNVNNVNQQYNPVQPAVYNPQLNPQENNHNFDPQSPYANTNYAQIPVRPNPFNSQNPFNNPQPNQGTNFDKPTNVQNPRYLPPTTTERNLFTQTTTELPVRATEATTDVGQEENTNQPTESPITGVDNQDPNISIANAVAGADPSLFYLQQPDGRLQKVILQKTQDPNGRPEEYTANYYFQNIEALPSTVYSPLITLG